MTLSEQSNPSVSFRTPALQRVVSMLFALFVGLVVAFIVGLLIFINFGRLAPAHWSVNSVVQVSAGVAIVLSLVGLWLLRAGPSRLNLDETRMRASGLVYRRSMHFDNVALVAMERPDNTIGKSCKVIVRDHRGKGIVIWLSAGDAAECHATLRSLCPQASAIDVEGGVHAPEDDGHRRHGMLVAADEFTRRGRRRLLAAAVLALLSASSIAGLVVHYQGNGTSTRSVTRRWVSAVLLPLATVGAAASGISNLRFARKLRNDKADEETSSEITEV